MKVIDCTIGFNELDLFRTRFHELDQYVDEFIIVEATHTHAGHPKPLYFSDWYKSQVFEILRPEDKNINFDKIEIIVWDNGGMPTDNHHAWFRENMQREILGQYLTENYDPYTIVMLSDMDEIPRGEALERFLWEHNYLEDDEPTFSGVHRFEQDLSYLYFNTTAGKWNGTKIFHIADLDMTAQKPMTDLIRYRPEHMIAGTILNGGWHFSSCGGIERVRTKFDSYAHTEMQAKATEDIADSLERLVDPFNKNPLEVQSVDFLPNYVKANIGYFARYIYSGNS